MIGRWEEWLSLPTGRQARGEILQVKIKIIMRIGINARFLTKPFTGIGQVCKGLISELVKIDEDNEYILVVPEKVRELQRQHNLRHIFVIFEIHH